MGTNSFQVIVCATLIFPEKISKGSVYSRTAP